MTHPYEYEIEVRPVTDDAHAQRILELLRAEGYPIYRDDSCETDDGRGYVYFGMTELVGGTSPEEAHEGITRVIGSAVRVTSRWRDLDRQDWDEVFGLGAAGGEGQPAGDAACACAICATPMDGFYAAYRHPVCRPCDARAVNAASKPPKTGADETVCRDEGDVFVIQDGGDWGDNPVFIDGLKCWRRYKLGGWVTIRDPYDCETASDFFAKLAAGSAASVEIWDACRMDTSYYEAGEAALGDVCEVRLDLVTGELVVSYDDEDGPVLYRGRDAGGGHFHLTCPERDAEATLHRFEGGGIFEGFWKESGARGMWRIWLER